MGTRWGTACATEKEQMGWGKGTGTHFKAAGIGQKKKKKSLYFLLKHLEALPRQLTDINVMGM